MKSKLGRVLILILIIDIILCTGLALIYKWDNEKLVYLGNEKEYTTSNDYSWWIDDVSKTEKQYIVEGWIAKLGKNIENVNRKLVLISEDGNIYGMNTIMVKRVSVTDYFEDGNNYDNSGFQASCLIADLEKDISYALGIIVKEEEGVEYLIKTNDVLKETEKNYE